MLRLAGVDLIADNESRDLESFISRYIPSETFLPWLRRSWTGFGTAGITYPTGMYTEPLFKLNRFRWPVGASRWAYGHFLCSSDKVSAILNSAVGVDGSYPTVPFIIGNPESGRETATIKVSVLPPTPLSGIRGLTGPVQSLYLLTIVDQRFFWWNYNFGDSLSIDGTTTWNSLYSLIFSILNVSSFSVDNISTAYLNPSTMFNLPYEPLPPILDAIAFNVGQRIVVNFDGSVSCQNALTAIGILINDSQSNQNTRALMAGGQIFAPTL